MADNVEMKESGAGSPRATIGDGKSLKRAPFLSQVKLLVWKNLLMKKKQPVSSLFEILLPMFIGLLLTWLRTTPIFTRTEKPINWKADLVDGRFPNFASLDCSALGYLKGKLVLIPQSTKSEAFRDFVTQNSTYLVSPPATFATKPCFPYENVTFMENEATLSDAVKKTDYVDGTYAAAVVFEKTDNGSWSYKIRMPTSKLPATNKFVTQFNANFVTLNYISQYTYSGFTALQKMLDEWIIFHDTGKGGSINQVLSLTTGEFPTPAYTQDNFWAVMSGNAVLYFLLVFLWPFTRMVKLILEERTLKIREGMKMMGVSDGAIWSSWVITYVIVYALGCFILALILKINMYTYTSAGYLFLLFFSFAVSIISLGFLFTVLFKNVRTAIQVAILVFVSGYIVYRLANGDSASPSAVRGLCLFAPACFGAIVLSSSSLESAGLGVNSSTFGTAVPNLSFGGAVGFFFLDAVLYMILTWYLGNVIPSEYGTTRKWWFIFDVNFWFPKTDKPLSTDYAEVKDDQEFAGNIAASNLYEEVAPNLAKLEGVKIRRLHKEFPSEKGQKLVAVESVDLDMFEGEVFALLGHNGAGKTTTISMLTGLIDISSGDAKLFGRSVKNDIDLVHNMIGVCPQQNVLFDLLTVREHLVFFAGLKGVSADKLEALIESVVRDVGLTEKLHSKSMTLSGGQKRKLCVAISFIGDPRIVFLDEPTSGMDVNSRRSTWDLIKKYKKNRVIVLTTHFMDEADLLADRIAIMAKGSVVCCGSSLFLKSKFGVGYTFIVSKKEGDEYSAKILDFLRTVLAKFEVVHDIGAEIFIRIPLNASPQFPKLFRDIESQKDTLGVINYGISVTTLEEVFLKVGHSDARTPEDMNADTELKRRLSTSQLKNNVEEKKNNEILDIMKMSSNKNPGNELTVFVRHFGALLTKRWQYLKRDKGTLFCLTCLPFILMVAGVAALTVISFVSTNELTLDFSKYKKPVPIPYTDSPSGFFPDDMSYDPNSFELIPLNVAFKGLYSNVSNASLYETAQGIYATAKTVANPMYGGYGDLTNINEGANLYRFSANVYANQTALHALPIYINAFTQGAYKRLLRNSTASIKINVQPLPQTRKEQEFLQRLSAILVSFFFNQALIFVPSTYIVFIVTEKQSKAKHQQLISGVSIPAYWLSNFAFDLLSYLPLYILELILTRSLRSGIYAGDNFGPVALLFFTYGAGSIVFSYALSFFFKNPLTARILNIVLAYIFGPILSLVSFSLNLAGGDAETINKGLMYIWRIFPGFNLGNGLLAIAANAKGLDPWSKDVAGDDIATSIWEIFVYLAAVILSEYLLSVPSISKKIRTLLRLETDLPRKEEEEDSDVLAEKERIRTGKAEEEMVQVRGLRKVYDGKKVAVKDLWYSIPKGECFGFLGINGAGKTTTLEILSGDIFPTLGSATLGGHDILNQQLAVRRLIGYCPQFDALFNLLTAREHLEFYAKLKGVKKENLTPMVDGMLHYLSLTEYADRPAGTYSGGNKRKLSVAMALIGDPPIVFLDEPSSGMDPVARRFMWRFISETMEGRSVILTTHSMDECEALCNRIGIMVGGRLRCLGTAQHLKNKFGAGYQLDLNAVPQYGDQAFAGVLTIFPNARLLERHEAVMKFQIPKVGANGATSSLADIFEIMEAKKEDIKVKEYSVSQTSLEQIFIYFAKQQEEETDVATGFQGVVGLAGGETRASELPSTNEPPRPTGAGTEP